MPMRPVISLSSVLLVAISAIVSPVWGQHDHGASLLDRAPDSPRSTAHQEGLHVNPVGPYAIVGAMVHRTPTSEPALETIVIDHGKIVAIGSEIEIPVGAKKVDATGKHLYAGLIDGLMETEIEFDATRGTTYWNNNIRPQVRVVASVTSGQLDAKSMREAGFTAALVAPNAGIIKGQSSLLMLGDEKSTTPVLRADVAQHLQLTVSRGRGGGYPNSPMGAYALARQSLIDANWYQQAWAATTANSLVPQPENNESLAALKPAVQGEQMVLIDTSNELFALRADRFAREFGLKAVVVGSGNEYRRLNEVAATGRTFVLPVNFPKAPDVSSPELASDVSLETMMHWDHAPENPARMAAREIPFVFTSLGLKSKSDFLKQVRQAVERGLDKSVALHAMTLGTAQLYGVENLIGTLEKNKLANITITDGDLFDSKTKITGVAVDGALYQMDHAHLRQVDGKWKVKGKVLNGKLLVLKESGKKLSGYFTVNIKPDSAKPEGKADPGADQPTGQASEPDAKPAAESAPGKDEKSESDQVAIKSLTLSGTRLTGTFESGSFGKPGVSMFSLLFADNEHASGQLTLPDGSVSAISVTPQDEWEKVVKGHQHTATTAGTDKPADTAETVDPSTDVSAATDKADKAIASTDKATKGALFEVNYPLGAFGRQQLPAQPASVLIKNVTLWTLDESGKLENASVLFGGGRIQQVLPAGSRLPSADVVIDGKGYHLTPGLIDCHSHMASDSGINESGQAITAEVRIGDMIDSDDITIYRQLAGGVTAANILHGSANPIGGQNQVIKLRWGANEEGMKMAGAPQGIKFALGENVKQSNWSDPSNRYPQTRMGVEQIIDDALRAAEDYQARWDAWNRDPSGLPPRRDLELEALAEIVAGKRWIHCHSYRQDEILALIRTLDNHHITIGSFQHILEGYKVADAMAEHGAMASAFADWWAYKYEVKDAIPFAGALMHNAGVVVSFNSDDGELGRHLNHEAVKAVRYGGVSEVEALKFVSLNPARQLRIDDRVGSIEVGKDADLVLWSSHPLSNMAVVKQTWVDGRLYFDRKADAQQQTVQQRQRVSLIQKILASGEEMVKPNADSIDPAKLWPRYDEFCGHHLHNDHGHDHTESTGGSHE